MKRKELKKLAKRLAELEIIIQNSPDGYGKKAAQHEVLMISSMVEDVDDMLTLDEMVQEILKENS